MDVIPEKSPNDLRDYKIIQMGNQLKALLISDSTPLVGAGTNNKPPHTPKSYGCSRGKTIGASGIPSSDSDTHRGTKRRDYGANAPRMSAASICIPAGSFLDYDDLQGCAHLTEHILFMGSQKFPTESGLDEFLASHGGSSNGFTDCEHMVISLYVDQTGLYDALARLANLTFEPLMRKEAINREIHAVDSEFKLAIPKDKDRLEQMYANLARNRHAMSKFTWGNLETLHTKPKMDGISVHERIQMFHKDNFVPNHMTLVVHSSESIDELEQSVRKLFSAIPSSSKKKPAFDKLGMPFNSIAFNKLIKVVPVENIDRVLLSWYFPSQRQLYRAKPLQYIGWLLSHEGSGSIASFLGKRNWKYDLVAGVGDAEMINNSCCCIFQLSVSLSEEGFNHIFEVLTVVFDYVAMLRSARSCRRIYEEIRAIEDNAFRFEEMTNIQEYVENLSIALQIYNVQDCLTGHSLIREFKPDVIEQYTNDLQADKVNIMLFSKSFESRGVCKDRCRYFGTQYGVNDIPAEWLSRWMAPVQNNALHLPPPNVFITKNFAIVAGDIDQTKFPTKISESERSQVWFHKDETFTVPHAHIFVHLKCPLINQSCRSLCMTDTFVKMVEESLMYDTYDARIADLSYFIMVELSGICVNFSGYNEKIGTLFQMVLNQIFTIQFTNEMFESALDEMKGFYHNQSLNAPRHNADLLSTLLVHNRWSMVEKLASLPSMSIEDLREFVRDFLATTKVQILVQGNVTAEETIALEQWLLNGLAALPPATAAASNVKLAYYVTQLPPGTVIHRTKNYNVEDDNSALTYYLQIGPATLRQNQMMDMLMRKLKTSLRKCLRAERQLGYEVTCSSDNTFGILGCTIELWSHSERFSMSYLCNEIEKFLDEQWKGLDSWMTKENLNHMVSVLVRRKEGKALNLKEESEANWSEIIDGTYMFDRVDREINELKQVTLTEFRDFCTRILEQGVERKIVSFQVCKDEIPKSGKDHFGNLFIEDLPQFKASCRKYSPSDVL